MTNVDTEIPTLTEVQEGRAGFPKTAVALLTSLGGLLLVVGLASSWFFGKIDTDYSLLVALTAANLDAVHDLGLHSGVGFASLVQIPLTRDPQQRIELLHTLTEERAANDIVLGELRSAAVDADIRACLDEVMARRGTFRRAGDDLIAANEGTGTPEAGSGRWRPIQRAYTDYQQACDKLANLIRTKSLQMSDRVTADVRRVRWLFFGLGISPLFLALALVVLIVHLIRITPPETDLH